MLAGGTALLWTVGNTPVEAGGYICGSGECFTSIFSGKCFHCLVNPAPAYCSCTVVGSCPQAVTLCGNCSLACNGTVIECTDRCPGCSIPYTCGGGPKTGTTNASTPNDTIPTRIRPTFSQWINSQSLLAEVSATSPLMKQLLLHMRQVKKQWGCDYIVGLVVDPNDPGHLQSKLIIHSNEAGVTVFTIFNRSTDQDEILVVDGVRNTWNLSNQPSYASETPAARAIVASGTLSKAPSGSERDRSSIDNAATTPIHPTFSQWIESQYLLDGVSAFSPLMKQVLLHMRESKEEWDSSYITGLVVDPSDPRHLQSKLIIHSNEAGISTFTIFNRSTSQDEILIVHGPKNMWNFRILPSYASSTRQSATVVAHGSLDGN